MKSNSAALRRGRGWRERLSRTNPRHHTRAHDMTLLERTLSKAYRRQPTDLPAAPPVESRGWITELRAPQRVAEPVPEPPIVVPQPLVSLSWPAICEKLTAATGNGFAQLAHRLR